MSSEGSGLSCPGEWTPHQLALIPMNLTGAGPPATNTLGSAGRPCRPHLGSRPTDPLPALAPAELPHHHLALTCPKLGPCFPQPCPLPSLSPHRPHPRGDPSLSGHPADPTAALAGSSADCGRQGPDHEQAAGGWMPRRLPSGPKGRRGSPAGAFDSMGRGRGTKLNCGHVGSIDGDGTCPDHKSRKRRHHGGSQAGGLPGGFSLGFWN